MKNHSEAENEPEANDESAPAEQEPSAEAEQATAPVTAEAEAESAEAGDIKIGFNEIEDPEDAIAWLKENAMPVLVGLLIAALSFLAVSYYKHQKKAETMTAQSMLFNSQASAQFSEILTRYAGTPSAPLAELSLGAQQFDDGQYDLAKNTFATFARNHPDHPLVAGAVLGQVQCDEAELKLGDALKGYESFMKAQPDNYMNVLAVFGKGRCLEQMGRYEEARQVYEDYIAGHQNDPWAAHAETALKYVGREKRAAQNRVSQPQVSIPPLAPATMNAPGTPMPLVTPAAKPVAPAPVTVTLPAVTPAPAAK